MHLVVLVAGDLFIYLEDEQDAQALNRAYWFLHYNVPEWVDISAPGMGARFLNACNLRVLSNLLLTRTPNFFPQWELYAWLRCLWDPG